MRSVVLTALLVVAALADHTSFRKWAQAHGKVYTGAEELRRSVIFTKNMEAIRALNAEANGGATFAPNKFSDLTPDEFRQMVLGTKPSFGDLNRITPKMGTVKLPESFDWRDETPLRINPVQDQGNCGSCWAFSATSYLEGLDARTSGELKKLSEQNLVDCCHQCKDKKNPFTCNWGCNGGFMVNAMNYALDNGMMLLKDYKYTAKDGKCKYSESRVGATFNGTAMLLPAGDEEVLRQRIYTDGPISVAVNASPWSSYAGGVFTAKCANAESDINHGVLAVGWGTDEKTGLDYWIIRNSWGSDWGEDGYIRLQRGINQCGVANDATLIDAN